MSQPFVSAVVCFCLLAGSIGGCATDPVAIPGVNPDWRFTVTVDAMSIPGNVLKGKTYFITSAMKDVKDGDLEFRAYTKYVENVLSAQGYTRVDSEGKADHLVRFGFGLGTPQTTVNSYTTTHGYSYQVGWMWYTPPSTTQVNQVTSNTVNLMLEAYDLKTPGQQVWKTTMTGCTRVPNNIEGGIFVVQYSDVSDLRVQLPYMIAAAGGCIGNNTGRAQTVEIMGSDPRVADIVK